MQNKVMDMATEKTTSVKLPQSMTDEILDVVEQATGIKPNVTEFVRKAVNEKLEQYRNARLQPVAGSQKLKKAQ